MQKGCQQRRTEEVEELTPLPKILVELRRAKRASEAPWVRKFGKPSIRENLVMTYVAYTRTLFAGEGRESGVSPSGGGVCYKSRDAFVQRNGVAVVVFKNMFTSTTSLHKDFVTVVLVSSKLFRKNCYDNKQ